MGRLRKVGLWILVMAGLLQALAIGLILNGPDLRRSFPHLLDKVFTGGLALVPIGGVLAVIGWACGPRAGGINPALGGSRVVASLAGITLGQALVVSWAWRRSGSGLTVYRTSTRGRSS
jgi:hypothetical protein